MAGTTREERKALMADAHEGAEEVEVEQKPKTPAPAPVVESVPPPVAAPSADMSAMFRMFIDSMVEANRQSAKEARHPIPESYLDGGFPEISVFSHPDGDLKHPPTQLKCPMFMGVYDEEGKCHPVFPIIERNCKETDRVMLNQLTPGIYRVERNDGRVSNWRVVIHKDDLDQPIRLVIATPQTWLSKEEQAQMPGQPSFLKQLTTAGV